MIAQVQGEIVVGGQSVAIAAPARTWHDHGLFFGPGHGAKRRTRPITCGVAHWTGGENPPDVVYRVLRNRKPWPLSVEFCIDASGTVWQFADPLVTRCSHAGYANGFSWGIEMVNYGTRSLLSRVPRAGRHRGTSSQTIHGRSRKVASFYRGQIESARALVEAVHGALDLPVDVPRHADGRVYSTTMSKKSVRAFRGVLGHFHISRFKLDPGPTLLSELASCA